MTECKNCGMPIGGNYCSNCGQPAETGKIDSQYLLHEFQHSVLHVNRGILYTIKELLVRPGDTLREYLAGKRVKHFKPFAFVVILGAIYSFMAHFFNAYPETAIVQNLSVDNAESAQKSIDWFYNHYSLTMLAGVPILSLASYWVFRKKGYNYFEHLVINAYLVGIQILAMLVAYMFYYYFSSIEIVYTASIISYLYCVWAFVRLFKDDAWFATAFRSILSFALFFVLLTLITFVVTLATTILNGSSLSV